MSANLFSLSRMKRFTVRKAIRRLTDACHDYQCTRSMGFMLGLLSGTCYSGHDVLENLFRHFQAGKDDVLVDVGCSKGRVVAFLSARFPNNRIIGIEPNDTALFAQQYLSKNPRVEIRHGLLENEFPENGTMFYIFPPRVVMLLSVLKDLIDRRATRPVCIVASGPLGTLDDFRADPTWSVQRVSAPRGWYRGFNCTYSIYRTADCSYGAVLRKTPIAERRRPI